MDTPATVTAEGANVAEAVVIAARLLGVEPSRVEHKLDMSHFRTADGRVRAVDTVKIIARARAAQDDAGARAAVEWLTGLLGHMEVEAKVTLLAVEGRQARVRIDSPRAAHLVGRQGSNLAAIRHLLERVMDGTPHADWSIDLSVEGGERPERRERRDDDRGERRERRDDRGGDDRRFEGRRERRDDRGDRRDRGERRDRRDDRGGDDRRSEVDIDKLRSLARKLAADALRTGEEVRFRRPLNSFERRAVHLELQDMDGVRSESEGDGPTKIVVIRPTGGAAPAAD